ncbi:exodeoxyribonuclease VII small subunit [Qingrenia yutianensis]|uniref:Exodeoxyribonuclease 7 small subunit n=1 Tax=Qingrenia yutianensis TaxID=2763676 RepID=A0A926ITU0_9FIRM|nr:exodeoxyribonuclease VII small subunit [Qingrenia yutianensis]MBC8596053.1 exodeoxyribonuclease VII small subunit [Qingrenia yutianensis]
MNKFEDNITRLDEIVKKLEDGNAALDECVALFEDGVKLTGECIKMLDDAEQKIKLLVKNNDGEVSETDFVQNDA